MLVKNICSYDLEYQIIDNIVVIYDCTKFNFLDFRSINENTLSKAIEKIGSR